MNSMITVTRQTKSLAGFVAIAATVFTCGGTLILAEHYSGSSAAGQDYLAAAHQAAVLKKAS